MERQPDGAPDAGAQAAASTEDSALVAAPRISGIVVDESGAPVPGARVRGWPEGSGAVVESSTDSQGRFTLALEQAERHFLDAEAPGFAKYEEYRLGFAEDFGHPVGRHAVGENDVRIVLGPIVRTTFVVHDALTSEPVTLFGVRLFFSEIVTPEGTLRRSGGEPSYRITSHPDGEFTCEADPARFGYVIDAPGYSPASGRIHVEPGSPNRCVVLMRSGGTVEGRVMLGGAPVYGAKVLLYEKTLAELYGDKLADENDAYWNMYGESSSPFFYAGERTYSGKDGRFQLNGLETNEYRLEITTDSGARRAFEPIGVLAGSLTSTGDVELMRSASLRGRVLVPPGFDPGGITVRSWVFDIESAATTDPEGRFFLQNLCAGRLHLDFEQKPGTVVSGEILAIKLAPGEVKEQEFDLRGRAGCTVDVEVRANGVPVKDAIVSFQSVSEPTRNAYVWGTSVLGKASKWTNAIGVADGVATTGYRLPLCRIIRAADLSPGASLHLVFDGACGGLNVEWPSLLVPDDENRLWFTLDDGTREHRIFIGSGPNMFGSGPVEDARRTRDNRVEFDRVASGDYRATIQIVLEQDVPDLLYSKPLSVRPGTLNELVFTKADLVKER